MTADSGFIEKNRKIIVRHNQLFCGNFVYHVPDGTLFYENKNGDAYFIESDLTSKELAKIISDDIVKGVNSIPERFKKNKIVYEEGCIY